jgi:hypothetical protein
MADKPRDVIVPIVFDEETLSTDLEHFPDAAGAAVRALRQEIDRDGGLPHSHLKACEPEGRDGTRLAGCAKTRIPWPDGPWGIVFGAGHDPKRPFALYTLAYGRRHPTGPGQLSVYQVASRRLAEIVARDLRGKEPQDDPAG